jgi:hypothetical protein
MILLHEHLQCHGELIGVEDVGLFKALVIKDHASQQVRHINISRENCISEIVFESDAERKQFVTLFAEQTIEPLN